MFLARIEDKNDPNYVTLINVNRDDKRPDEQEFAAAYETAYEAITAEYPADWTLENVFNVLRLQGWSIVEMSPLELSY